MVARMFRKDRNARIPFALVAVILLVGSSVLSGFIARPGGPPRSGRDGVSDIVQHEWDVAIGTCIRGYAVRVANQALEETPQNGSDLEDLARSLEGRFIDGFDNSLEALLKAEGIFGWRVVLDSEYIGLDLQTLPDGRVVGTVNWTATSSQDVELRGSTGLSEDLGHPWALGYSVENRLEYSGNEDGELAALVKGMLFRLATVRSANGVLEGDRVLSSDDVGSALNIALDLVMNSSINVPASQKDPSNLLIEALNLTTVESSSVLAQYIVGLLDYYLLWFRDYSGIGEGAESFFQWLGEKTDDEKDLSVARESWYEDLKVRYLVERWAFQVMASVIHMVIQMSGDDVIDFDDRSLEESSTLVIEGVNATGDAFEKGFGGGGKLPNNEEIASDLPAELSRAMEVLPTSKEDLKQDVATRLEQAVVGAANNAIQGLVRMARDLVRLAYEDLIIVDELHGMSPILPQPLMRATNGADGDGRFIISNVVVDWSDLSFNTTVRSTGIHDTAPEARLKRAMSSALSPGNGAMFSDIRPYETDYHIRVTGLLVVHRLVFQRLDRLSALRMNDGIDICFVIPINLSLTVPVFSGVPFSGVDYDPSDTLYGDLEEAAWGFINGTWGALNWAAGCIRETLDRLAAGARELGRRGLDNLGRMSAGNLSHVVENILRAVYAKAWNEAMNISWRLLKDLVGEDLKEMLTFNVTIMGFDLTVQLDLFNEMLTVAHSSDGLSFTLSVKRLAEEKPPFRPMPVEGYNYALLGTALLQRGRLSIFAGLDPFTVVQPYVVQVIGESRDEQGRGFRFELDAPVAERAFLTKAVSLSSVLGSALTGIPIPGTGMTFDIDAGIRIRYGRDVLSPEKLLVRAVKSAWYQTLEGYSVKELYEDWKDPVLLEAFIIHLLNNIANSVVDVVSEDLPEIEIFVDGKVAAAAGTVAGGFSLSFVIKEPVKVIRAVIPWVIDNLRVFLTRMAHPGLPVIQTRAPSTVLERLFVRCTIYTEAGLPDALGGERYGRAQFGALLEANLPALGALAGRDIGRWMFRTGAILPALPSAVATMIPGLDPPRPKCDLWLFRLSVMELDNDRAKLSEVYYDTKGPDTKEEFVEIWNPTERRIDISRWVIVDQGGEWTLPDHLNIPSGERLVVARNRDGFRAAFKELPDVSGLTLSLNNDGDLLELYDPWGVRIDSVAWEGGAHGWNLKCKNGQSLQRNMFDTDTSKDWHCGPPNPGR